MIKIGFLPFYLALYDQFCAADGIKAREFAENAARQFENREFEIITAPVCRLKKEFSEAVRMFEKSGCEAILSLHLAYSPSMEAVEALAATDLPLVILDTTPDASFEDPGSQVMANHGIHGVQDLGNLLNRSKKHFLIAAGEFDETLFARTANMLRSAVMAYRMNHARIGRLGGSFAGMGDFCFSPENIGIAEVPWREPQLPTEAEITAEMAEDRALFRLGTISEEVHRQSTIDGLRLRKWVNNEQLDGFTMCFTGVTRASGWMTVPFLECSKSMARGIGYAGEGDTLTAALHAALFKAFPEVGFAEMFCPDWKGNKIFISHMGEINLNLTVDRPLLTQLHYIFGDADDTAVAYGCFKPGKAYWVNPAPLADGKFRLVTSPIEFVAPPEAIGNKPCNAGWITTAHGGIADFLAEYTRLSGTHHAAVVYDADATMLRDFAHLLKWEYAEIGL